MCKDILTTLELILSSISSLILILTSPLILIRLTKTFELLKKLSQRNKPVIIQGYLVTFEDKKYKRKTISSIVRKIQDEINTIQKYELLPEINSLQSKIPCIDDKLKKADAKQQLKSLLKMRDTLTEIQGHMSNLNNEPHDCVELMERKMINVYNRIRRVFRRSHGMDLMREIKYTLHHVQREIERLEEEKVQDEIDSLSRNISHYESLGDAELTADIEKLHKKRDDLISIKHELTTIDNLVLTARYPNWSH